MDWTDQAALSGAVTRLSEWLEEHVPDATGVEVTRLVPPQGSGGYSNHALLVDAAWAGPDGQRAEHELFARIEMQGQRLVLDADLVTEGRLLTALDRETPVPVPRIFGVQPGPDVFGSPFLVMERVTGRVMPDDPPFTAAGWVLDLDPDTQATYYDHGLRALASVTTVDWRAAGLGFLDHTTPDRGTVEERVDYLDRLIQYTLKGRAFPLIESAFEWVREHAPTQTESLALSWGDARPGNLMYAADSPEVAAIIDWEHAVIGSPELDLGWWLYSNTIHSKGTGHPLPPGFPDRTATIARFEELTGHAVRHLDFYEAYAGVTITTLMVGIAERLIAAGVVPPDAPMLHTNPASIVLADLLGLPAPDGQVTSWARN